MSDTFHGRSRESLIEEIRELREYNDFMVETVNLVSEFLLGDVTLVEFILKLTTRNGKEPKP